MTVNEIRALTKEELNNLYIESASITSLAVKLGSNRALLSQILYEKDIIKIPSLDFELSEDYIIETYKNNNLKNAAGILKVKPNLLSVKLKKLGVLSFDSSNFWENITNTQEIQNLLDLGLSLDKIAEKFNKTDTRSLRNYIKKHNLKTNKRRNQYGEFNELKLDDFGLSIIDYYNNGHSQFATANYFNINRHTLDRFFKRTGVILTEVELKGYDSSFIQKELYLKTLKDLALELDVFYEELSLFCLFHNIIPGLKVDRTYLLEKYFEFGSIVETAKFFNITVDKAANILEQLGVDTSKSIATKLEIELSMKDFLFKTKGVYSESGWMLFSGYDRDQLRHYFGSAKEIKEYFCIKHESIQDCFLNFFETTFGVKLLREENLGCIYPETKGFLRFDGYCKEWNLLIEYDDESHYFDSSYWKTSLIERLAKDHYKDMWANYRGYFMLRVPYTMHWTKDILVQKLREIGCNYV